jgi:hypothetical protein
VIRTLIADNVAASMLIRRFELSLLTSRLAKEAEFGLCSVPKYCPVPLPLPLTLSSSTSTGDLNVRGRRRPFGSSVFSISKKEGKGGPATSNEGVELEGCT